MFSRNYSRLLELYEQMDELFSCLCDEHLTELQLFQAQKTVARMLATAGAMRREDDGYPEINAILSRLDRALLLVRRFSGKLDGRWKNTVQRALHVLNSVVSSRLSDELGDSNVKQCIDSLDALLTRGRRTRTGSPRPDGGLAGRTSKTGVTR